MLKRTFESKDPELWKELFVSLVSPPFRVCCESVESSPARGHLSVFEKLEYQERLKRLSLTNLKNRRLRGDLNEMYKVTSNRENVNWVKPLNIRKNIYISGLAAETRKTLLKIRRQSFSSRIRKNFCFWTNIKDNFFVNRVAQTNCLV